MHKEVQQVKDEYKTKNQLITELLDIRKKLSASEALEEQQKKIQWKLKKNEIMYRLVFENTPIGLLYYDENGIVKACNDKFGEIVSTPTETLVGINLMKLQHAKILKAVGQSLSGQVTHYEGEYHTLFSNKTIFVNVTFAPIRIKKENVSGGVAIVQDVTERIRAQQVMNHMAYHDNLTDLPNRFLFNERLKEEISIAKQKDLMLAVLFIDLDSFKDINDSYGHAIGDQLLISFSHRLSECLREGGIISRFGGDEFTILLPRLTHAGEAAKMADHIISLLKDSWMIDGHEIYVTASIGICLYPSDAEDVESLLDHADKAMYRAKDLGKNNYTFYDDSYNMDGF